ncbi:MAG: zinc-binding dehydrogenase [Burkholderiaceae bacterium]
MTNALPTTGLQLRSLVRSDGTLELSLADVTVPKPAANEVLIRIEAAPLNPSDLGLVFGAADMKTAVASGSADRPVVTATIPPAAMKSMTGRLDQSMPPGNEGAGVVIDAGSSSEAQALIGKRVAALGGGGMYAQYRCLPVASCLVLPEGATSAEGASCFVNPLTALGMTETMRAQGHTALVHTAAASNLGQMLNRICIADGIGLVNIVRRPGQAELLKGLGAKYVCVSTAATFIDDLTDAIAATGATLAFDATGGGWLAGQILGSMEAAISRKATSYDRYGSSTHKQVYLYGGLDTGPTEFVRNFGMAWGIGGWLVFPFLQTVGAERTAALKQRVADELKTTFASHYQQEVSLVEALSLEAIAAYDQRATGAKFLVVPNKGS